MNKVTIITGPQESGKTRLARKLAEGKKAVFLENFRFKNDFKFNRVNEDTELIVIDDINVKDNEVLVNIKMLINSVNLTINKQGKWPVKMQRPELIIISEQDIELEERKYVSVIRLKDAKDFYKSLPIVEDESKLDRSKVIEKAKQFQWKPLKFGKSFCFFLLINLIAISAFSQFTLGLGLGYDFTTNKSLMTIEPGYELKNIRLEGQFTPSITKSPSANNFMGFKIGYDIANFLTPSVGYYYNLVSTDNKELNKNYVGYSAKLVIPVNERGGVFMNAMYINKSTQFTFGAHCIF